MLVLGFRIEIFFRVFELFYGFRIGEWGWRIVLLLPCCYNLQLFFPPEYANIQIYQRFQEKEKTVFNYAKQEGNLTVLPDNF